MFKNYLKIAIRNLFKNKGYVLINTLGLGIALACCITAYLVLAYNIEFDSFHDEEEVSKIFKIHAEFQETEGGTYVQNLAPMVLGPIASSEISGIERYTRYITDGGFMRYGEYVFAENIAFADSTFFELFDFPLRSGSHESFKDKSSVFISLEIAKKYFADEDPFGKQLTLNFQNEKEIEVLVGGVIDQVPSNNTFYFDVLLRIENFLDIHELEENSWSDWRNPTTFVELVSAENAADASQQLARYVPKRNEAWRTHVLLSYQLEQFHSNFTGDEVNGSYVNLRIGAAPLVIFSSLAVLILLVACFNLTNTSMVMTSKRLKEVGVRKVMGAVPVQVILQFLFETVLIMMLSLGVGLLVSQLIVPEFTAMWGLEYGMRDLSGLNLVIILIIIVFTASLLAGMYPALLNSRFRPAVLLKGSVRIKGTNVLTRILVSMQFALSIIVLVAGVIFIQNTRYQERVRFGYEKDNLLVVDIQSEQEYNIMANEAASQPQIAMVAGTRDHIGSNYETIVEVDTAKYKVRAVAIGKNYFETIGFTFLEGRNLNADNASDQTENVVVNEAFLLRAGIDDSMEQQVVLHGVKRRIVGVVNNHLDNLFRSKDAEPFIYYLCEPWQYRLFVVSSASGNLVEVRDYLEKTWKENFPTKPFESRYQDDIVLGEIRSTNANLEKIFLFLTILGGLLSVSGIFSLVSLNIAKRTKEIGIRKALGATIANVLVLINHEFVVILTIAGLLGSAGGFFLTDALLSEIYDYHIPVGIASVVLCAISIFCIGLLTTSTTILKAAVTNPVDSLRSE